MRSLSRRLAAGTAPRRKTRLRGGMQHLAPAIDKLQGLLADRHAAAETTLPVPTAVSTTAISRRLNYRRLLHSVGRVTHW